MKTFVSCEGPVGSGITASTVKHFKHSSVAFSRWPTSSSRRLVGACVCTRWTQLRSALLPTSCRWFHIQLSQLALGPLVRPMAGWSNPSPALTLIPVLNINVSRLFSLFFFNLNLTYYLSVWRFLSFCHSSLSSRICRLMSHDHDFWMLNIHQRYWGTFFEQQRPLGLSRNKIEIITK